MKIVVCPSDQTGCGKYRLIWPGETLRAKGHNIIFARRPKIMKNERNDVLHVDISPSTDVIVFQRPGSYEISELIPILHGMGIKVIIDLDDDLETIHPLNPAFDYYNPEKHPTRNWKWVMKACGMADVVTATTESLLEKYAQKTQGFLIPNCIPERFLDIQKTKNELITVGYAGHTKSHPNDLQVTHGAINEAIAKQEARFMAIGGGEDVFNKLGIRNRAPHKSSPPVDFDEYPNAVAQLDIGIVPLADTFFNECKSWLKTLEYAALGVAPVISPTRDNMRMIELGGAYMARTPKEWRDNVRTLINNEEERLDLVKRARAIAADWTIEANAWRWKEAWCGTL